MIECKSTKVELQILVKLTRYELLYIIEETKDQSIYLTAQSVTMKTKFFHLMTAKWVCENKWRSVNKEKGKGA